MRKCCRLTRALDVGALCTGGKFMQKFLALFLFCALALTCADSFGAAAGDSDCVKAWYAPTFESIKESTQPMVIYIYDAKPKLNHFAEKLESKNFLSNSDVADRTKKFRCIKIKVDDKNWPGEWTSVAVNGAALMVMSSDRKHIETFDKNTDSSRLTSAALVQTLDSVLNAEPKEPRKVAEKKEPKKEPEEKNNNGGLGIKGLGEEKKPADPKGGAAKVEPKKEKPAVVDE
jgi:hypothetical protein